MSKAGRPWIARLDSIDGQCGQIGEHAAETVDRQSCFVVFLSGFAVSRCRAHGRFNDGVAALFTGRLVVVLKQQRRQLRRMCHSA